MSLIMNISHCWVKLDQQAKIFAFAMFVATYMVKYCWYTKTKRLLKQIVTGKIKESLYPNQLVIKTYCF